MPAASRLNSDRHSKANIDLSWVDSESATLVRPGRFFRWDAFFLAAASVLVVVGIGGFVATFPNKKENAVARLAPPSIPENFPRHKRL